MILICTIRHIYSNRKQRRADTGKSAESVTDNLEAVPRKIENGHQGSIAGYRISQQDTQGTEHVVQWDGKKARALASRKIKHSALYVGRKSS